MSEMLELRHISKTFGAGTINEKKAVEDLSLTLASGGISSPSSAETARANPRCSTLLPGVFYVDEGRVMPGRRGYDVPAGI